MFTRGTRFWHTAISAMISRTFFLNNACTWKIYQMDKIDQSVNQHIYIDCGDADCLWQFQWEIWQFDVVTWRNQTDGPKMVVSSHIKSSFLASHQAPHKNQQKPIDIVAINYGLLAATLTFLLVIFSLLAPISGFSHYFTSHISILFEKRSSFSAG